MGQARGPHPQERGGVAGEEGAATAGATAGADRRAAATTGEPSVRAGLKQFLKVTRSYWPGLFRCYDAADLPRTNNDLEHTFGSHRYHERRSSGRRRASPGLVVMGWRGWSRGWRRGFAPKRGWGCRRAMWRVGESCERSWRDAVKVGASNGISP